MAIVFVPRGIHNAYNEGAEKGANYMNKFQKKVILNHTITIMMEVVWTVLIIVGMLILVAEDQTATAIMLGVGLVANIVMIINEYDVLKIWLESIEDNSEETK